MFLFTKPFSFLFTHLLIKLISLSFIPAFYLTGHSDVVMGLVSVNREDLYERLKFLQNGELTSKTSGPPISRLVLERRQKVTKYQDD